MGMPETTRWRKAMLLSAVIHCALFACAGFLMLREFLPPAEELIEVSLVSDFSFGTGGRGGGGESMELGAIKIPQINVPKVKESLPKTEPASQSTDTYTEEGTEEKSTKNVQTSDALGGGNSVMANGGQGDGTGGGNGSGEGMGSGTGTGMGAGSGSGDGPGSSSEASPPGILARVKPSYPASARRGGIEGTVYLRVHISEAGRTSDVSIAVSSGDASLDNAAVQAVYKWRFIPAKDRVGNSIACYTQVPITFRLTDA